MFMIWLVFGPSGVGKTSFGHWLATERHWMHLEIDLEGIDGIDYHDLRAEWDEFLRGSAHHFRQTIEERMKASGASDGVLTFPGCFVLTPDCVINASHAGIGTIYLYSSQKQCLKSFLERERHSGRNYGREHWYLNRHDVFAQLRRREYIRYRVEVFTRGGSRRLHAEVFGELLKR